MAGSLTKLSAIHYRAMALRMEGYTLPGVADAVRRSEGTVRNWFSQEPVFRDMYVALCAEAKEGALGVMYGAGISAAKHVVVKQDANSEMVGLLAAKDILDRIGLNPVERRAMTNVAGEDAAAHLEVTHSYDFDGFSVEELRSFVHLLERATSNPAQIGTEEPGTP